MSLCLQDKRHRVQLACAVSQINDFLSMKIRLKILPERFKVGRDNQTSASLAKSLPDKDRQQGNQNVDVIGKHLLQGSCMEKMTPKSGAAEGVRLLRPFEKSLDQTIIGPTKILVNIRL